MKMDSGKRRITISKNGIEANQNQPPPQPVVASSQVRPSSRAPRKEGTANFSHFRGADNPEWRNTSYVCSNKPPPELADVELFKLPNSSTEHFSLGPPQDCAMPHKMKHHSDMASFADDLHRRLQDIDAVADVMVKKVQNMKKEMHTRKEMDDLNDDFNGPNRLRIISQAKREMRKNKRILIENRELRHSLAEHQTVLEMVMNKFRRVSAHAANLERTQTVSDSKNGVIELKKENQKLAERVGEMLSLMSFAISHDNRQTQNWMYMNTKIKQLQNENGGLRELLHLSKRNGSIRMSFDSDDSNAQHRTSSEESPINDDTTSSDDATVLLNSLIHDEYSNNIQSNSEMDRQTEIDIISDVIKNELMLNDGPDFCPDDEDDESCNIETCSTSSCSTIVNAESCELDIDEHEPYSLDDLESIEDAQ